MNKDKFLVYEKQTTDGKIWIRVLTPDMKEYTGMLSEVTNE